MAARWRHSPLALGTNLFATLGVALPSFLVALLLQLAALWYTRHTGRSLLPMGGFGWDLHLVLPALVLAARPIAQVARVTFNVLSDAWGQDYVRTARGKGASENRVLFRHIFRNAAIPILTTLGTSLRFSLSSLPVVELFFSWPGVGFNLLRAISQKDDYLTVALSLCLGLLFILVNWLLDGSYRMIDPRLRQEQPSIRERGVGLLGSAAGVVRDLFTWLTDNRLVRWLARRQRLVSWRALDQALRWPRDRQRRQELGLQSLDMVDWLVGRYGRERVLVLLAALRAESPLPQAVRHIFGRSLEQLESDWRRQLGQAGG